VLDWNKSAIDFYRKLGAEFWNEWKAICLRGSALEALARGAQRVEGVCGISEI
jgi:hypothetical protein